MSEERKNNKPISLFSSKPKKEKESDAAVSGQGRFNPSPFSTRPSPFGSTGTQYTPVEKESESDEKDNNEEDKE